MKKKYVGKTYARNNFFNIIKEVKDGQIYCVSDRDNLEVAIVPIKLINKEKEQISTPISQSQIYKTFYKNAEIKNSIDWVNNLRNSRKRRLYGK